MMQRRRFDNPQGPFRVWNAAGVEAAIMPTYDAAIRVMIHGDRLESMSQEEYDREMAEHRAGQLAK
jgi:hypothetical protein